MDALCKGMLKKGDMTADRCMEEQYCADPEGKGKLIMMVIIILVCESSFAFLKTSLSLQFCFIHTTCCSRLHAESLVNIQCVLANYVQNLWLISSRFVKRFW